MYHVRVPPACFTIYLSDHLRWRQSPALLCREMAKGREPEKAGRKHFCFPCTTADVREISVGRYREKVGERAGASLFRTVVAENDSAPLGL